MKNSTEKAFFTPLRLSGIIFFLLSVKGFSAILPAENTNKVYKSNVRTVQLHKTGNQLSAPVLQLHSQDKLELAFDDLDNVTKNYKYTFIHCEADWSTSSGLIQTDYISGFNEDVIDHYEFSLNTTIPYIHYSLLFPTQNLGVKISGNYIIKVYDEDTSNVVLTRRFMIAETTGAEITGKVQQAPSPTDKFTKQEVDFEIAFNGMRIANPGREIKVVVTQNDRWDNVIRDVKPRFVKDGVLDYNFNEQTIFNGGNEFRNFDTKSLIYQSERIRKIFFDTGAYQVFLLDDVKRTTKNYITEQDINGRLYVKNEEHADNSDIEADYAWIYFFLPLGTYLPGGNIYMLGELTGWQIGDGSQMEYNPFRKGYEKRLFLKQGYYNYIYVYKDKNKNQVDEMMVEGSHWETENEYTVWIYYHEQGSQYDRLIVYRNFISNK
jgi:hypothetical protein